MLGKLMKRIEQAMEPEEDPVRRLLDQLDDPLAERVEWTPASGGGSNIQTRRLVETPPNRLSFKPTSGMLLFLGVFAVIGPGVAVFGIYATATRGFGEETIALGVGLGLTVAAGVMFYVFTKPVVIDKQSGCCWRSRKRPLTAADARQRDDAAALDDIHAIQIIREWVRGDKSSYYSYEINLVRSDGSRLNLVDHGKPDAIREDARRLGEFLGVPVWDASG